MREESDSTLILNLRALEDGTLLTREFAQALGKPCCVVQLDAGAAGMAAAVSARPRPFKYRGGDPTPAPLRFPRSYRM